MSSSPISNSSPQRPDDAISRLPPELIQIIFECLAVQSETCWETAFPECFGICFALSCKYTYNCFEQFLKLRGQQMSQLLPFDSIERYTDGFIENDPDRSWTRENNLRLIQTDHLIYCNICYSLHPTVRPSGQSSRLQVTSTKKSFSTISPDQPRTLSNARPLPSNDSKAPKTISSSVFQSGTMVDVCPCICIDFEERTILFVASSSGSLVLCRIQVYIRSFSQDITHAPVKTIATCIPSSAQHSKFTSTALTIFLG